MAPLKNMKDTRVVYKVENVSYGVMMGASLSDGSHITFASNKLTNATRLDERNLCHCLYLNLFSSSITELKTEHLGSLRILIILNTKIRMLDTIPFLNLEWLNASYTPITELQTQSFG